MKIKLALIGILLQLALSGHAQDPDYFRQILNPTGNPSQFLDVAATTDTAFIAVGKSGPTLETSQFLMAKVKLDGTPVWAKTFDAGTTTDELIKILPLTNGEFVVVGRSFDANNSGSGSALVGKFNSLGQSQWIRHFDDPNNLVSASLEDVYFHFEPDYLVVSGRYNALDWVLKLGMDGQLLGQQVLNPGVTDTQFVPGCISMLNSEFYLKRSFSNSLQNGTIFYKLNTALGLESSKAIVTLASNPLTIFNTNIFSSTIIFSGEMGLNNQKSAVFGSVDYANEKVMAKQYTFPNGFKSQWANGFYTHPTKGIEYMMAGTVATSTESKAYTLFLDGYDFSVNTANWSSGNSRIQAYGISQDLEGHYAICGVVESGTGPSSFHASIARTDGTDAFACGEVCAVDTAGIGLILAPFSTSESSATFQSHSLISPAFSNLTNWTTICSPTLIQSNMSFSRIEIYPNPVQDRCLIKQSGFSTSDRIQVQNVFGQTLFTIQINSQEMDFDVSTLSNGIYSIRVDGKVNVSDQKFVKY